MTTQAIVVGINKYAGGWDLVGPENDASRFTKWLGSRALPDLETTLFVSPGSLLFQDSGREGVASGTVFHVKPATSSAIYSDITERLRVLSGDLLIFFWSGHGVLKADGTRRLLYADSSDANLFNLNLQSLLISLRSDYFGSFTQQIVIIDACANYIERLGRRATMPDQSFPTGLPEPTRQQFVLMSAKPGELSANLGREGTGLFSKLLDELLPSDGKWPPDMPLLASQIGRRFNTLRLEGKASQTPTFFSYVDWNGNEGAIGTLYSSATPRLSPRRLSIAQKQMLADVLLRASSMLDPRQREAVLRQVPNPVYRSVPRLDAARGDVYNIVDTCDMYGALGDLLRSIETLESDIENIGELKRVAIQLGVA